MTPGYRGRRAVKPIFARSHVAGFADNMAAVAEKTAAAWSDENTVDLDSQCRLLTMRAPGHAVLGLDLADHEDRVKEPLRIVLRLIKKSDDRPTARTFLATRDCPAGVLAPRVGRCISSPIRSCRDAASMPIATLHLSAR